MALITNNTLVCDFAACVNEYFREAEIQATDDKSTEDPIGKGFKAVLDSKSYDETMVIKLAESFSTRYFVIY